MAVAVVHHRFTVQEYDEMIEYGILSENDRVELIRGEILEKMPICDPHMAAVKRLNRWFQRELSDDVMVGIQDPVHLADSEPEPDVSITVAKADFYESGKPKPHEILLLIEVADSSLEFDRETKGPLYAENGIREYWVVNVADREVDVFRNPDPSGRYADHRVCGKGESISLVALPNVIVPVDAIFG